MMKSMFDNMWVRWIGAFVLSAVVLAISVYLDKQQVGYEGSIFSMSLYEIVDVLDTSGLLFMIIIGLWLFMIGLKLMHFFFMIPFSPFAVAQTILREALRMHVPVICVLVLLIAVPLLSQMTNSEVLRYQIQFFLTASMMVSFGLIAFVAIFLTCGTMSNEVEGKHYYMTMVKPMSRATFLFGKWLGVVAIVTLLTVIAGWVIFSKTFYMSYQPAQSMDDRLLLQTRVLTAREIATPYNPRIPEADIDPMIKQIENRHKRLFNSFKSVGELRKLIKEWNEKGGYLEVRTMLLLQEAVILRENVVVFEGLAAAEQEYRNQASNELRTLVPNQPYRRFIFKGLDWARDQSIGVMLSFEFEPGVHLDKEDMTDFQADIEWRYPPVPIVEDGDVVGYESEHIIRRPFRAGSPQQMEVPTRYINEAGELELQVRLAPGSQFPIVFPQGETLNVYHQVTSFQDNFIRMLIVTWVKMVFLATVSLVASTFLTLPIASLLALSIVFMSLTSNFVMAELAWLSKEIQDPETGLIEKIYKTVILHIDYYMLKPFLAVGGGVNVIDSVSNGLVISWHFVLQTILVLGFIANMILGFVGWLVFRSRELARVQV